MTWKSLNASYCSSELFELILVKTYDFPNGMNRKIQFLKRFRSEQYLRIPPWCEKVVWEAFLPVAVKTPNSTNRAVDA